MTWDVLILIRRGVLVDGSGSPGTVGDIALAGARIVAIGGSLAGAANRQRKAVSFSGAIVSRWLIYV